MNAMINHIYDKIKNIVEKGFTHNYIISDDCWVEVNSVEFDWATCDEGELPICYVNISYKPKFGEPDITRITLFLDKSDEFNIGFVANHFWA